MKNSEVEIGSHYIAKVSRRITVVKVTGKGHPKGWCATNLLTGNDVYFKTGGKLQRLATESEISLKDFGIRPKPATVKACKPVGFEIPDGPRCESLKSIIEMMANGATLPNVEPIPEATAEVFGRIANQEFDAPVPPKEEWVDRVKVIQRPILNFSTRDLAEAFADVVDKITGRKTLTYARCEEIIKIREKLFDILK